MTPALSSCGWLVLAFVAMAMGIAVDHGHYSIRAIALIGLSAGLLVFAAGRKQGEAASSPRVSLETVLLGSLVFLLVAGVFDSPGYHVESDAYRIFYIVAQLVLAGAVVLAWIRPRLLQPVLLAGVVLGFGLRVGMVISSPAPAIDVFTQFQESAAHLLHGLNPFSTAVSDPSHAQARFGYEVTGYAYPPANLYVQTISYAVLGDIRYASIAFELIAAGCLMAIVPVARRTTGWMLVLLFLFHPRGLFVIEQAWNEPLLVGSAGLFLWLAARRPQSRWTMVALGVFLSLKQYLVFFALLFFARPGRWRWVLPVSVVILVTWLPFLIWDANSAVSNGLLFQFRTPFRADGLTLSSLAYGWVGWQSTKWVAIGVGLVMSALCSRKFGRDEISGYLHSSVLTTLAVFLCGSQAFANYYYFLGAMILFLIALRLREEEGAEIE